jgi:hypothetical protein
MSSRAKKPLADSEREPPVAGDSGALGRLCLAEEEDELEKEMKKRPCLAA